MADSKLARVLEQVCPRLKHIQGEVQRSFDFENGLIICPVSFMDMFESESLVTCNLVTSSEEDNASKDQTKKRPADEELEIENLKKQRVAEEQAIAE